MKTVRITGAVTGLIVVALGIFLLITLSLNPRNAVNAIYEIIFGLLIFFAEWRLVRLLKYFYFLQHFLGLGMFYIYVGFLCLGGNWYQYAVAGVCLGVGLIYFILGLGCRKMGRENFRRSGVEPPATAADGTPSAPPAAGGGAKAAAAATNSHCWQRVRQRIWRRRRCQLRRAGGHTSCADQRLGLHSRLAEGVRQRRAATSVRLRSGLRHWESISVLKRPRAGVARWDRGEGCGST